MNVGPVCPRCGEDLVARPGSDEAWCHLHGAVTPLHHTAVLGHDTLSAVCADARVPAWVPDPMPGGWAVTGVAWGGEPGARGIVVDCAGPAPLGGPAELVLVAEEPGTGLGAGYAGLPWLDPGELVGGPSTAAVTAAGQRAALWSVPTADDRSALVGEAFGVWLWLVTWPATAAWLLAEDLVLVDLRDRVPPDLPLGPPGEHFLPGA
ncbi:MAG: hypothetical protein F2825_07565 [Actinobacteria bacterium]|jgi:hypothetical protein|uniref:DUF6758 family protein n=1 Tax=Klenkia terrae TaxID=1052259 RepID=A0ABU8E6B1_9ACTN|nr:hypothetical protein [Actinomycetota bacterium]